MRIAVVSDIHGNLPALQAVRAEIEREHVELTLNLGDILSCPLWPRETAELLMPLAWPTIAGNHERQALAIGAPQGFSDAYAYVHLHPGQRAWLAALPPSLALQDDEIVLTHGTPGADFEPLLETVTPDLGVNGSPGIRAATAAEVRARLGTGVAGAARLVLCGHSHVQRVTALGATLVVNPGSVGLPAYDHDHPHDHRVECGSPHARWAIVERVGSRWQVQLRLTAYDWGHAAARAEANGRGDWADALATGYVGRTDKPKSIKQPGPTRG